ncbi:unnamed protein product [Xylocopa violacea]|uniref:Uncharacterized protein n=1 Tax=Xylocopa violacea TaxID=135666 RepID=A0ABP1P2B9_XYLVO
MPASDPSSGERATLDGGNEAGKTRARPASAAGPKDFYQNDFASRGVEAVIIILDVIIEFRSRACARAVLLTTSGWSRLCLTRRVVHGRRRAACLVGFFAVGRNFVKRGRVPRTIAGASNSFHPRAKQDSIFSVAISLLVSVHGTILSPCRRERHCFLTRERWRNASRFSVLLKFLTPIFEFGNSSAGFYLAEVCRLF